MPVDGILGMDFLTKYEAKLDYGTWTAKLKVNDEEYQLKLFENHVEEGIVLPARSETIRTIKINMDSEFVLYVYVYLSMKVQR